jgi:hypothetical protein
MSYPADPHWANVKNLLLFDGVNGDKRIPDEKGSRWTVGSTAVLSSVQKKFGNTALYCDGSNNGVMNFSDTWTWGTVDQTIELWVFPLTQLATLPLVASKLGPNYFAIAISGTANPNKVSLYLNNAVALVSTIDIALNVWTHIAVTRTSTGVINLFLNGVFAGTTTNAFNVNVSGSTWLSNQSYPFKGYIGGFRYTPGVIRYPTDFTPPTAAFPGSGVVDPYYDKVVLHMHCDGENGTSNFVDQNGHEITLVPSNTGVLPKHSTGTTGVFWGDSCLSVSGGVLQVVSTSLDPTTEDFTLEFYAYITSGFSVYKELVVIPDAAGSGYGLRVRFNSNSALLELTVNNVVAGTFATGGATFIGWISVCRVGANVKLYQGGVLKLTYNIGTTAISSNNTISFSEIAASGFYFDEIRYTKGLARYTGNYSVPTAPFPHVGPNFLSGTVLDSASQPLSRTVRSFRRSDGLLIDTVTSNATTGAFELRATDATEHFVMVFDDAKNAMVYDHLEPILD